MSGAALAPAAPAQLGPVLVVMSAPVLRIGQLPWPPAQNFAN
jgi:hypothetical protein